MHALVVVAHPVPGSLVHHVAAEFAVGVAASGPDRRAEIADLAAEGFDPRFTAIDVAVHLRRTTPAADVLAEQARIDRAHTLVLVYPVYWWSMPGLLKGWIDRVFSNGWAYDSAAGAAPVKRLRGRQVHLVGVGGADAGTYARHGYRDAMRTQIDHGIFEYCGACVATSELLLDAHEANATALLRKAHDLGRTVFDGPTARAAEQAGCAAAA